MTNEQTSPFVRTLPADTMRISSYIPNMARRGIPKAPPRWFLVEWMAACGMSGRGAQAKMMERTGWSKATMSQLFNGTQDYSPAIIEAAAAALEVEPFELLLPPERAMALRDFKRAARVIASDPPKEARVEDQRKAG